MKRCRELFILSSSIFSSPFDFVHLSSTHFYIKPPCAINSVERGEQRQANDFEGGRDDNLIRLANIKSPLINWQLRDENFSVKWPSTSIICSSLEDGHTHIPLDCVVIIVE